MKKKIYYLTLSEAFPSTHIRAGQPTNFEDAFKAGQVFNRGSECLHRHPKLHTIRANYEFWRKRFEKIKTGEACLSIREWIGRPYGKDSYQREIARLTHEDGIGIQKLEFRRKEGTAKFVDGILRPFADGKRIDRTERLANNDGLSFEDWEAWFKDYDLSKPMAIIHFTKFRY